MSIEEENEQLISSVIETGDDHGIARRWTQYFAAFAVSLGALAAGTTLAWSSPAEVPVENGALGFPVTPSEFGWIGALVTLGAATICFPITFVLDSIGRKPTMLLLIIPFTIGWAIIYYASSVWMLCLGRFLCGIAGGAFCVTVPLYTSEIASKEIRGSLGSYFQLFVTLGILFVDVLGTFYSIQTITLVCALIPFVFGLLFITQPETAVFYMKKRKIEKARESLEYFRGPEYNVDAELTQMLDMGSNHIQPLGGLSTDVSRGAKKAILICFGLMFFQQFTGVNAIIFYAGAIFEKANVGISANLAVIIIAIVQVVTTFFTSLIIDKAGRRILLLISSVIIFICTATLAVYFQYQSSWNDKYPFLPVATLSLFFVAYSLGLGPVPWVVINEIVPKEMGSSSTVSSSACTFSWLLAFLVTKFYGVISAPEHLGQGYTFYSFAGLTFLGFIFVFILLPETKGKTLHQIQCELNGVQFRATNDLSTNHQNREHEERVNESFYSNINN